MTNEERILSKLDEISKDITEIKIEQARMQTLMEAHIDSHRAQRANLSERWKIVGIISAIGLGIVSIVSQFIGWLRA